MVSLATKQRLPYRLVKGLALLLLAPVALVVRLLRPLVLLRFGPLISSRIGHLAANTDVYLSERARGLHPRSLDLFFHDAPPANQQLARMIERVLPVSPLVRLLAWVSRSYPGGAAHELDIYANLARDVDGLGEGLPPPLTFTPGEESRGRAFLEGHGLETGSYVCALARDPAYLRLSQGEHDFEYHRFRDTRIETLAPALRSLAEAGTPVLRMGAAVERPLPRAHPRVLDYAREHREDFLDVYLGAHCRFCLCDTAGYYAVPALFRRPVAFYNFVPLAHLHTWDSRGLTIPKLLWSRREGRLLRFSEILDQGLGDLHDAEDYERAEVEVRENTPEEVEELALEMEARLAGTWGDEEGDEERQQAFWSLFRPSPLSRVFRSRIGAAFLRRHQDLLDLPPGREAA